MDIDSVGLADDIEKYELFKMDNLRAIFVGLIVGFNLLAAAIGMIYTIAHAFYG